MGDADQWRWSEVHAEVLLIADTAARGAVAGVGCDIQSVCDVQSALRTYGSRYVNRLLDPSERGVRDAQPMELTQRFAVKEAVAKALGVPSDAPLPWPSIVVHPHMCGHNVRQRQWTVRVVGYAGRYAERHGIQEWKAWSWQENQILGTFGCAIAIALNV